MRTLFLECNAGASGDMILGALTDLLKDPAELGAMLESSGIPGVRCEIETSDRSSITGTSVRILVDGVEEGTPGEKKHHEHHSLGDVMGIIAGLKVSDRVKKDASEIYSIIAEAESQVHGKPVSEVHFHEVGALDAIADIVGVCLLVEKLAPEQIISSPLRTGYGTVECAHGVLPVPAPATANILKGMPVYAGDEEGEFTTPTGAAIIKHFAARYAQMPVMEYEDCGIGFGKKSSKTANMLRAYIGEAEEAMPTVTEIRTDIDDMTPEDLGGIIDLLMASGALDASICPVIMKKSRPGYILSCICRDEDTDDMAMIILAHTSSVGLRFHRCQRYEMKPSFIKYRTDFGDVRIKISEGYGLRKWKPEHDDMTKAAITNGVTVDEVRKNIHFDPDEELGDD
ncbi:MAG: TIGR00299 family protein [Methanomethylophilus alvi]|nr:MAG: TIGR00299 family protein [Methanomethylophilus alvi]